MAASSEKVKVEPITLSQMGFAGLKISGARMRYANRSYTGKFWFDPESLKRDRLPQSEMKTLKLLNLLAAVILPAFPAAAAVHYVNLNNPTPSSPYTTWSTAATDIQSAITASVSGDTVLV